jgi:endonuclease/exonuclease/phosphatase (EEP) superfamily protein YafD
MLARLPLSCPEDGIPDADWMGDPVIANVTFEGRRITIVSCHGAPVRTAASARERQARAVAEYARGLGHPCIVMGDFNSTPFNVAYGILAGGLKDAWRVAGRGFGHTFPGPGWINAGGDGLPRPLRRFVPHWLMRIDHIFVSDHWRPLYARVSLLHGGSDHRAVVADLALV